jgi:hypothetical protein
MAGQDDFDRSVPLPAGLEVSAIRNPFRRHLILTTHQTLYGVRDGP